MLVGFQMGLIKFSDRAEMEFDYSEYDRRSDIIDHVSTMEYTRGRTNTADALRSEHHCGCHDNCLSVNIVLKEL